MSKTLWYPPELSSLHARARQTNKSAGESLDVVLGSNLLSAQKEVASNLPATIETGCPEFDNVLRGHIRAGLISLAGQDDAIVTMLSLYIGIGYLVQCRGNISIVDTAGSFDVVRMLSVVKYRLGQDSSLSGRVSAQEIAVLDRVHISRVFDAEGLEQTLRELESHLANAHSSTNPAPNIIVIGSIANMFAAEITKNKIHGHARLDQFCLTLRRLAMQHQVVFMLLNTAAQTGSNGELTLPLVLGRTFVDLMDVSMMVSGLEHTESQGRGNPEPVYGFAVLEDQSLFSGKAKAHFRIRNGNQLEFLS